MKYNYRVELVESGGKKQFYFILPDEIRNVTVLFNYDVQSVEMGKRVIDYCLQVQNGQLKEKVFTSNSCSTTIKSDYVQIVNRYAEEDNICSIETSEFKLLLEAFVKEKKRYLESIGFNQ